MDLDVVFLGTAGSMPTAQRAPSSLLVRRGGERLLVDCGEGTQRQLLRSEIGLLDLREVFLTHYHADHYLGPPGDAQELRAARPRGADHDLRPARARASSSAALRRIFGRLTYGYELVELRPGERLERDGYALETFAVEPRRERASATRSSRSSGRGASTSRRPTRSASRRGPSAARSSAASP